MSVNCEIKIVSSNPNKTEVPNAFVVGQRVKGTVKYTLREVTTWTEITICLKGVGKVSVRDKCERKSGQGYYYKYQIFENIKNEIVAAKEGQKVPVGTYVEDFDFLLPNDIPPSFAYKRNRGRYKIKSSITHQIEVSFKKKGFLSGTTKFKKELVVIAGVEPRVTTEPLIYGNQKRVYQLFNCKKQILNLKSKIEKSIVKPGDKVNFSYELTNDTNLRIVTVRVKILETYIFKLSKAREVKVSEKLFEKEWRCERVPKRSNYSESFEIEMPKTTSTLDYAKHIKKEYYIHMTVVLPCIRRNLVLQVPILVDPTLHDDILDFENGLFLSNFMKKLQLNKH